MRNRHLCFTALLLILALQAQAQQPPFWNDIQAFKKQDSLHRPPHHAILFVGSSSFTKWTDVQNYFPGYVILNRGFGGSNLPDEIRYVDDIITPYRPKQIVIYCGENDVATGTVNATQVSERFQMLFRLIRLRLPKVPILYISMKPSPSRVQFMPIVKEANHLIQNFLQQQRKAVFVNIYDLMLAPDGKPRPELFGPDMLHMNKEGYTLWQKAILPCLRK